MELRQNAASFEELGYQILTVTMDRLEYIRETVEKFNIPFPMLSDSKAELVKKMGIAWHVAGRDDEYYANLEDASGEKHHILPAPSTFILDTDGLIRFEFVSPDFKVRPKPELLLAAAKASLPQTEEGG